MPALFLTQRPSAICPVRTLLVDDSVASLASLRPRSRLRTLDGVARIFLDEHAAGLPADGQQFVRDIRRNAQKMG